MSIYFRSSLGRKNGNHPKATCFICGKGIFNRMLMRVGQGTAYAHFGCVHPRERHDEAKWQRVW